MRGVTAPPPENAHMVLSFPAALTAQLRALLASVTRKKDVKGIQLELLQARARQRPLGRHFLGDPS